MPPTFGCIITEPTERNLSSQNDRKFLKLNIFPQNSYTFATLFTLVSSNEIVPEQELLGKSLTDAAETSVNHVLVFQI